MGVVRQPHVLQPSRRRTPLLPTVSMGIRCNAAAESIPQTQHVLTSSFSYGTYLPGCASPPPSRGIAPNSSGSLPLPPPPPLSSSRAPPITHRLVLRRVYRRRVVYAEARCAAPWFTHLDLGSLRSFGSCSLLRRSLGWRGLAMVDWKNPECVAYIFYLYDQIAVFLLGFYGTQYIWSLSIEWELITRKRAFRATVHLPWLLARYVTLSALLFFVITGRSTSRILCDAAYRIYASLGSGAAMLASLTLCMRPATMLWTLKRFVPFAILAVMALAQLLIVILQGVLTVRARWDPHTSSCEVLDSDSTFLAAFYLYTFCYDVAILGMTLYAVHRVRVEGGACRGGRRWRVGDALCVQGIGYVAVTCMVNVPVAVLAFLDLNAGMNVLLSLPAVTISVIASSLTLFALDDFNSREASRAHAHGRARRAGVSGSVGGSLSDMGSRPGESFAGHLTTHLTMDISGLDSVHGVFDDDLTPHLRADKELEGTGTATPSECMSPSSSSEVGHAGHAPGLPPVVV
ncbi:hypothetical protein OH77DRAFT_1426546 [Trametes cingulata]|nr:hypothetical protein OH77DRAFT_1426546 [Trametes cingulata]